jgi:hypothetical protein
VAEEGGRCGARVGVGGEGDEHRAAEAEVGDTEASPNDGQWRLATGRHSGKVGTVTRAHERAEAVPGCRWLLHEEEKTSEALSRR